MTDLPSLRIPKSYKKCYSFLNLNKYTEKNNNILVTFHVVKTLLTSLKYSNRYFFFYRHNATTILILPFCDSKLVHRTKISLSRLLIVNGNARTDTVFDVNSITTFFNCTFTLNVIVIEGSMTEGDWLYFPRYENEINTLYIILFV